MDVSILSLIVAALAVVVGPMVAWAIANRQVRASLEVSNKQITAPMRQAWINKLRELSVAGVLYVRPAEGGDFRPPQPAHKQQRGDHGVQAAASSCLLPSSQASSWPRAPA